MTRRKVILVAGSSTSQKLGVKLLIEASYLMKGTIMYDMNHFIGLTLMAAILDGLVWLAFYNIPGHRALNGFSAFTLTTCVLHHLNIECRRHSLSANEDTDSDTLKHKIRSVFLRGQKKQQQEINQAKEEWNYHIQFIKDFMQFAPSLKLICSTGALTSAISLIRFGNLTTLNLQKVPINMVEGLQVLRGMLTSLTVYKSVSRVKDLLELCGKDMSVPSTWPMLKYLSLAFNCLSDLDDSLRLLPYMEMIDLSHNSLQTCGTFLEYLNDIKVISLAYNSLSQIPTVSLTTQTCLTCLVLRGNNLDNLTGVDELKGLLQLDLGENCLNTHRALDPLGALVNLHQLQLDGNPLFYHRLHRQLTASSLAHQAATVLFKLDKRKLTVSEISFFSDMKAKFEKMVAISLPHGRVLARRSFDRGFENSLSSISGNNTRSDSAARSSPKRRRKSRHKRLRARNTPIMDRDFSGEIYYSQDIRPASAPYPPHLEKQWKDRQEEAQKTKREIEELRKNYGQNWLLAIDDKDIFIKKKTTHKVLPSASPISEKNKETGPVSRGSTSVSKDSKTSPGLDVENDTEIADKGQTNFVGINLSEASKPATLVIAKRAAGLPANFSKEENSARAGTVQKPDFNSSQSHSGCNVINSSLTTGSNSPNYQAESGPSPVLDPASKGKEEDQSNLGIGIHFFRPTAQLSNCQDDFGVISIVKNQPLLPTQFTEKQDLLEYSETFKFHNTAKNCGTPTMDENSREMKMGVSNSTHGAVEEDEVLEPILVTCPLRGNEIIILSLTASFLVEKDVGGIITEQLELSSLSSLEWRKIKGDLDGKSQMGTEEGSWGLGGVAPGYFGGDNEADVSVKDQGAGVQSEESWQLDLKFDYMRKDKQSRSYMVDGTDKDQIMCHLQPFLKARAGAISEASSSTMQCLKCNQTFIKGKLQHHEKKLPKSGSSKDLLSSAEQKSEDTSVCPRCGSTIIIELTQSPSTVTSGSSSSQPLLESPKLAARRFSGLTKRFIRSVRKGPESSQPSLPSSDVGRDRSSAFKAPSKIPRGVLIASCEQREISGEELVCVEDYFSLDSMDEITTTSQLARLTSSLQGCLSSRGSKAFARKSLPVPYHKNNVNMAHSENKDINEGCKSKKLSDVTCNYPSSYPTKLFSKEDKARRRQKDKEDKETEGKEKVTDVTKSGTSVHTSLAVMTDIVNTLIKEGKHQEELERSSEEQFYGSGGSHVSSSQTYRKDSNRLVSNPIKAQHLQSPSTSSSLDKSYPFLGFMYSESLSSTRPISTTESDHSETEPPFLSSSASQPVGFHVGTPRKNHMTETSSRTSGSLIGSSLLSSSMPRVLKTSLSSTKTFSGIVAGTVENVHFARVSTTVTTDAESGTTFDIVQSSIYDHSTTVSKDVYSELKSAPAVDISEITLEHDDDNDGSLDDYASASGGLATQRDDASRKLSLSVHGEEEQEMSDEADDEDNDPNYGFNHLNHRLTLHMMMTLFEGEEEFLCKLQCPVVQYIIEDPYEAILIMSTRRFYILKVTSENHSQPPDQWVHCIEIQPIPELRYIDVGLGGQSLRLEFVTDCSSFTLITQNRDKTSQFVDLLHNNLTKFAVRYCITSHVIVNEDIDQVTTDNLDLDVVSAITPGQKLLYYCMGFVERENKNRLLVSLVVTSCDVCLVTTNHQWPQPRLQAPITIETVGKQFTVLDRQRVNNVASLEVCEVTCRKIKLELFRERDRVSNSWKVTLASKEMTVDFINALMQPWTREFGVEMDIMYGEVDF